MKVDRRGIEFDHFASGVVFLIAYMVFVMVAFLGIVLLVDWML